MADRSAAEIFGVVLGIIANELPPTPERERVVRQVWHLSHSYDFSPCQMEADDILTSLGLLRMVPNTKHPDEGELREYGPAQRQGKEP